jgi:hypothetical protein
MNNLKKQILRRFAPLNDIAENFNEMLENTLQEKELWKAQ